jgi:hypothetical protein
VLVLEGGMPANTTVERIFLNGEVSQNILTTSKDVGRATAGINTGQD